MLFLDHLISVHLQTLKYDILTNFFHKTKVFVFLLVEAETWVGAAVTVNVMGEVAVIIPTISPNEGR